MDMEDKKITQQEELTEQEVIVPQEEFVLPDVVAPQEDMEPSDVLVRQEVVPQEAFAVQEETVLQETAQEQALQKKDLPQYGFERAKGDTAFALFALIASVLTTVLGFRGFALGYAISSVFMMTVFFFYFVKGGKLCMMSVLSGVLTLASSSVFVFTTNGSVRFFGVVTGFLLALLCFDGFRYGRVKGNRQTLRVFFSAVGTVKNLDSSLSVLLAGRSKRAFWKALAGVLCALPVLVIVLPLLLSADDAFRGMMRVLSNSAFTSAFRAIIGAVMSIFVITYGFTMKKKDRVLVKDSRFHGIDNVYILSFLSVISLCYVLYLFSQLAYFFSAFRGFLPNGEITYAQYARKGFFEMCIIAVINLGLVLISFLLAKKENGKVSNGIKALSTFVAVFTLIIIATAISKMLLYIDAYGMTVKRLTTSAFMVFLAVVYLCMILRIYFKRVNLIKLSLLAASCIILVLGICNVNTVCAKYNYESYRSGKLETVDVAAMYHLGDEGIPYVVKLASDKDPEVAEQAKNFLKTAYQRHYFDDVNAFEGFTLEQLQHNEKNSGFAYFSIPRKAAYDSLYDYLKQNPDFGNP